MPQFPEYSRPRGIVTSGGRSASRGHEPERCHARMHWLHAQCCCLTPLLSEQTHFFMPETLRVAGRQAGRQASRQAGCTATSAFVSIRSYTYFFTHPTQTCHLFTLKSTVDNSMRDTSCLSLFSMEYGNAHFGVVKHTQESNLGPGHPHLGFLAEIHV